MKTEVATLKLEEQPTTQLTVETLFFIKKEKTM
jgi:hypothetical protein